MFTTSSDRRFREFAKALLEIVEKMFPAVREGKTVHKLLAHPLVAPFN